MMLNKVFNIKYIPNFLTIIRLFIAISIVCLLAILSKNFASFNASHYFCFGYLTTKQTQLMSMWLASGFLFIIAIISDALDGYIARKFNIVTTFGKFFDPIADKIVINLVSLMLVLNFNTMFPFWILIIFFIRDYIIDGSRMIIAKNYNHTIAANIWGKLKTILQMLSIFIIFFVMPLISYDPLFVQLLLIPLYLACLFSIVSGIIYGINIYNIVKKSNNA